MRRAAHVELTTDQRADLERLVNGRRTEVRVSERARIILLAGEGKQNKEIAELLAVDRETCARWRTRFVEWGIPGILKDAPRHSDERSSCAAVLRVHPRATLPIPPSTRRFSSAPETEVT